MSFSCNIFTSLPPVHTQNPDFLGRQLWLCFFAGSWISPCMTSELDPRKIPESIALRGSRHRQPEIPGFRVSATPCPTSEPRSPNFACSRIWSFAGSRLWKTHLKNFVKVNVSRVSGFPEFPNKHACSCAADIPGVLVSCWPAVLRCPLQLCSSACT
jgi:hypothetical protein